MSEKQGEFKKRIKERQRNATDFCEFDVVIDVHDVYEILKEARKEFPRFADAQKEIDDRIEKGWLKNPVSEEIIFALLSHMQQDWFERWFGSEKKEERKKVANAIPTIINLLKTKMHGFEIIEIWMNAKTMEEVKGELGLNKDLVLDKLFGIPIIIDDAILDNMIVPKMVSTTP